MLTVLFPCFPILRNFLVLLESFDWLLNLGSFMNLHILANFRFKYFTKCHILALKTSFVQVIVKLIMNIKIVPRNEKHCVKRVKN